MRFEHLDGQFRPLRQGSDQVLAMRTNIQASARLSPFALALEFMDSRQALADEGSPLSTGVVNTLEFVQAYVAANFQIQNNAIDLQAGRLTFDLGSRRFAARNRFRNTLNTFDGFVLSLENNSHAKLQGFYLRPVQRLPFTPQSLLDNEQELDESDAGTVFSGLSLTGLSLGRQKGELFLLHFTEADTSQRLTADSELYTAGMRLYRKPEEKKLDFELEAAYQFGEASRSRLPTAETGLDHSAWFVHSQLGYSFVNEWSLRVIAQFDYASGDPDPEDDEINRFNTLFGARRFDFGPTGIYGPFARSNLVSPGYRLVFQPKKDWTVMIAHRAYWLAAKKDFWTTTALRDAEGNSGSELGQQIETRIRWGVLPGNVDVEFGLAYLFAGEFMKTVPGNNGEGDVIYGYSQMTLSF